MGGGAFSGLKVSSRYCTVNRHLMSTEEKTLHVAIAKFIGYTSPPAFRCHNCLLLSFQRHHSPSTKIDKIQNSILRHTFLNLRYTFDDIIPSRAYLAARRISRNNRPASSAGVALVAMRVSDTSLEVSSRSRYRR